MAAEGEATNPAGGGGGGGGDTYPQDAAAEEAAQAALPQVAAQEPVGEMANPERAHGGGGAGQRDDAACRDLVLVEDPDAVAVEDSDEGTAPRSFRKKFRPTSCRVRDPSRLLLG
jgi:hypothetical protein